ncbi:MAG: tetratricopeptide repeat protein, partial [Thermoanaerobaculia bacterium]|nr:tetratricopeptide repeat protein [Thermoanaerobaculia bacterium]
MTDGFPVTRQRARQAASGRATALRIAAALLLASTGPTAFAVGPEPPDLCRDLATPLVLEGEPKLEDPEILAPCLAAVRSSDAAPWQVPVLHRESLERLRLGDYQGAVDVAREALAVALALDEPEVLRTATSLLGDTLFYFGDVGAALAAYERSHALLGSDVPAQERTLSLKNLGIAEMALGRPDRALWYLRDALDLARGDGTGALEFSILGNLGTVYRQLGSGQHALDAYTRALEVAERRGDPAERVDILLRIGVLERRLGFPEESIQTLEEAWELAKEYSDVPDRTWLRSELAGTYEIAGRSDRAIELLTENVARRGDGGNRTDQTLDLLSLGRLWAHADPRRSKEVFREARQAASGHAPHLEASALASLANAHRAEGDYEQAVQLALEAVTRLAPDPSIPPFESRRWVQREVFGSAVAALLNRHQPGDPEAAFDLAERSLAIDSLERLREAQIPLELDDSSREIFSDLLEVEKLLETLRSELDSASDTERREVARRLSLAETEHGALVSAARRANPRYAARHYPAVATAATTADLLPADTTLLVYYTLKDALALFLVRPGEVQGFRLPLDPARLQEKIVNYRELLAGPDESRWRLVSKRLHRDLLALVTPDLGEPIAHLIIVADGAIAGLPLETLMDPSRG